MASFNFKLKGYSDFTPRGLNFQMQDSAVEGIISAYRAAFGNPNLTDPEVVDLIFHKFNDTLLSASFNFEKEVKAEVARGTVEKDVSVPVEDHT